MINLNKGKLFFGFIIGISIIQFSCSNAYKKLVKEADQAFQEENYFGAAKKYKEALAIDSSDLEVNYKFAESSRNIYDFKTAEKVYDYVEQLDEKDKLKLSLFWLAMSKKQNGSYAEAMNLFDEYYSLYIDADGADNYFIKKAEVEIDACTNAKHFLTKNEDSIKVEPLTGDLNSTSSDFAPFQYGSNILFFSSLRTDSSKTNTYKSNETPLVYSKIYKSYLRDSVWSAPQELDYNVFNSMDMHTGNTAFSPDLKRVYFTRCNQEKNKSRCDIYMSKYEDGEWQEAVKLDETINVPDANNTTPCVASNGTKGEFLFWASDRTGTFGKLDLWYCTISPDGEFYGEPTNLGSDINTLDNELTPFYESETQTLTFSSEWHEGLGGFDIFKSKGFETTWTLPENIGFPFNTSANDVYYRLNQDKEGGYIASNRIGSLVVKGEICCNDIYSFKYEQPKEIETEEEPLAETTQIKSEKAIRALIPVTLYFHNDEPDSDSDSPVTNKTYTQTYDSYKNLEESYIKIFSEGAPTDDEANRLKSEMKNFFANEVNKGRNTLDLFAELLLENLEAGRQVTIILKGYTSPLNTAEYNKNLANRRIHTLLNYFNNTKNGIFLPYLKGVAPSKGFLTFMEDPIGEAECPPNVSDSPDDIRNSIYSPLAGKERRVQILSIEMVQNPEALDDQIKKAQEMIKIEKAVEESNKALEESTPTSTEKTKPASSTTKGNLDFEIETDEFGYPINKSEGNEEENSNEESDSLEDGFSKKKH